MYQYRCEDCGAYLDPGERCDCREKEEKEKKERQRLLTVEKGTGQLAFNWFQERMGSCSLGNSVKK